MGDNVILARYFDSSTTGYGITGIDDNGDWVELCAFTV